MNRELVCVTFCAYNLRVHEATDARQLQNHKLLIQHPEGLRFTTPSLSMALTFSADEPAGSNSDASQTSTMDLATSGPIARAPMVIICALLDLAALRQNSHALERRECRGSYWQKC